jgi:hypothetical protein
MALQKEITLPNGFSGNYIRIGNYRVDTFTKEAYAEFFLFISKAKSDSAPNEYLSLLATLRINGQKFDTYLANKVLGVTSTTVVGQLYLALRKEPIRTGGGLRQNELCLADAVDV